MSFTRTSNTTTCMRPGCTTKIQREKYACRGHWYSLPPGVRYKISRGYHNGSAEWREGHDAAQKFWAAKDQVKQLEAERATAQGSLFP